VEGYVLSDVMDVLFSATHSDRMLEKMTPSTSDLWVLSPVVLKDPLPLFSAVYRGISQTAVGDSIAESPIQV